MIFIKEIYKEDISPKVIEEYKQCIKDGFIKIYNPLEVYGSEDDPDPDWEIIELTEEDLLERIAKAKEKAKKLSQEISKMPMVRFF